MKNPVLVSNIFLAVAGFSGAAWYLIGSGSRFIPILLCFVLLGVVGSVAVFAILGRSRLALFIARHSNVSASFGLFVLGCITARSVWKLRTASCGCGSEHMVNTTDSLDNKTVHAT